MSNFQMQGYGSPSGGSGPGLLGFLTSALQGFQSGHKEKFEEKEQKQDAELKKQDLLLKQQEAQQTAAMNALTIKKTEGDLNNQQIQAAQGKVQALLPALFQNGNLQSDPNYVNTIKQAYQTMGLPAPIKVGKNGQESVDVSGFKKPFSSLDAKQQAAILAMQPDQRKAVLDQLVRSGVDVDKSLYKMKAVQDPKEAALMERIRHDKAGEALGGRRVRVQEELEQAVEAGDWAKVATLRASAAKYTAEAQAIPQRLAQSAQRISLEHQKLQLAVQRFQASPHSQQSQIVTASRDALNAYNQVNSELQRAVAARDSAVANGADPDSLTAADDEISNLQQQMQQLGDLRSQAVSALGSGLTGASAVGAASGRATTPVGAPKVMRSTSKSGKPIVSKDGGKTWEYGS